MESEVLRMLETVRKYKICYRMSECSIVRVRQCDRRMLIDYLEQFAVGLIEIVAIKNLEEYETYERTVIF